MPTASFIMPLTRKYNNPIGVFDSGLGGLTVVKQIVQLFHLAELAGYQIEFSLKKKKAVIRDRLSVGGGCIQVTG